MKKLQDKVTVITGAGRGIGKSIALAFAEQGSDLALTARSLSQLEEVAREVKKLGRKAYPVPCDVSLPEEVQDLARNVKEEFGRVDILVNNAGISKRSKLLEYDDQVWLEVLKVNLFGTYLCSKMFLPMMQKIGAGRIINIASTAAKNPVPFNTSYSASKHGVLGLTKSLASEVALTGYPEITVNAICPFYVNTEMLTGPGGFVSTMMKISGQSREEVLEKSVNRNLQRRALDPEEIASLALYLASDDGKGITGQAINVCGGAAFH